MYAVGVRLVGAQLRSLIACPLVRGELNPLHAIQDKDYSVFC